MHPMDQTSIFGVEPVFPSRISGAMYFSEPAVLRSTTVPRLEPNMPKSTTLMWMSEVSCPSLVGRVSMGFDSRMF